MDPRAVVHPVGPLPARVYWSRRLLLLAALLVVVAIVAVSCSGGSARKRAAVKTSPQPTTSASPTTTAAIPACTRVQLTVTAAADATTYAAGALPHLSVTIRNRSARPCRFADSAATRTWAIFSGPDRVWTDAGCASSHAVVERTVAAGASVRHSLVWSRHRSGTGCATSTQADPGTYRLYVTVSGQRSAPAVFHLTG